MDFFIVTSVVDSNSGSSPIISTRICVGERAALAYAMNEIANYTEVDWPNNDAAVKRFKQAVLQGELYQALEIWNEISELQIKIEAEEPSVDGTTPEFNWPYGV